MNKAPGTDFYLPVGDGHRLFVQTRGNPAGEPVLVLHGGPGSGCSPRLLTLYAPEARWIIAFDQRGAGRSLPAGATHANTTAHLVADIERLRRHLGIARWRVTGGSWGAALALIYAATHPAAVSGLVLRSSFVPGMGNVRWFFDDLAAQYPAAWQALAAALAPDTDLLPALARRLASPNPAVARAAALAWAAYEHAVADPARPPFAPPPDDALAALVARYRVQAHYLLAGCFIDEAAFFAACASLAGLPITLIHGRKDQVCPPRNAERLHANLPGSRLVWVEGCGHTPFHPAMQAAWRAALAG